MSAVVTGRMPRPQAAVLARILPAALASAILSAAPAAAVTDPVIADHGTLRLDAGFTPDPSSIQIMAGGPHRAQDMAEPGVRCSGYTTENPDLILYYEAGVFDLTVSLNAQADTAIILGTPDGRLLCDDDGGPGLNPSVTVINPVSGFYGIWGATYLSGPEAPATLVMSELGYADMDGTPADDRESGMGAFRPEPSHTATFGDVVLTSGFAPDPHRVPVVAGGGVQASVAVDGCAGWVSEAPDVQLTYTASDVLPLILSAASDGDATLLVNDPDGNWHCDDDGGNEPLNPALRFDQPLSGVYDIWIGSYRQGQTPEASLSISELYSE